VQTEGYELLRYAGRRRRNATITLKIPPLGGIFASNHLMNTTTIGWIGLGNMGIPMSQRLIKAGYPVTVYNRNRTKETSLRTAGAATAETPAALIQRSEVIFIMVTDDQAIRDIFSGENGLLRIQTKGKLIVNMSTVSPDISREFGELCRKKGNEYLDAP